MADTLKHILFLNAVYRLFDHLCLTAVVQAHEFFGSQGFEFSLDGAEHHLYRVVAIKYRLINLTAALTQARRAHCKYI